ncbi:MAG: peptidylprolyl isomerase [Alphaproteobacteria bacterium]|nr:peptidylprolyl isomerase [Alphaproteobacteria bacterium]
MKRIAAAVILLSLASTPVWAQRAAPGSENMGMGTGIVAVVNDNVITSTDLAQRLKLSILSSGLPDNPEVRMHLLPQILRSLIDEQLQTQEAKRLDLSVSDAEVDAALDHIAHDNHIPGDMKDFITAHGGSPDALTAQIRDGLLWNKVVQRELRPRVEVGDDEIDAVIERIRANTGKQEYLASEIFLAVDNPKDEEQVKQLAQNLVGQLKHGANFAAVAHQFSQNAGAAQGGDIGWIQQGQLEPELDKALNAAKPGELSDPIRTANGFHILGVREKRTVSLGDPARASVNLQQAFHPYAKDAAKNTLMQQAATLRGSVKNCADLAGVLTKSYPGWATQKLGDMNLSKAPGWITDKIRNVPVGGASDPLATDKGVALLFVCGRNDGGDIDRDAIMHSLGTEKLELQARRLLRDLRRSAYIDIRLGKDS